MAPTDGVLGLLQVGLKGGRVELLDQVHALLVQVLDGLPDLAVPLVKVRVLESLAPVAKVRRDDEQGARLYKVLGQHLPVGALFLAVDAAHHDRNNLEVAALT